MNTPAEALKMVRSDSVNELYSNTSKNRRFPITAKMNCWRKNQIANTISSFISNLKIA